MTTAKVTLTNEQLASLTVEARHELITMFLDAAADDAGDLLAENTALRAKLEHVRIYAQRQVDSSPTEALLWAQIVTIAEEKPAKP